MSGEPIYHPEAGKEFDEALRYYSERSIKAPEHFIDEFEHEVGRIAANPLCGHPCHTLYRRRNLKHFPYAIIYRPKADSIYVIAVTHEKRLPLYWLHRIEDDL
jgi:plasmid stabilization system protein ParE